MKPILFNTEMVRAILEGRKTVTRRVLGEGDALKKHWALDREPYKHKNKWYFDKQTDVDSCRTERIREPYVVGDTLYVRETWAELTVLASPYNSRGNAFAAGVDDFIYYKADGKKLPNDLKWRPSIHMPKKYARIFLKVTDVRIERLQDMEWKDIKREGLELRGLDRPDKFAQYRDWYAMQKFWDSTVKKEELGMFGWDANPWVWVIEFE